MSIHITLGKPGSGKSLLNTRRVIRELRESRRNIVTNLPLRPGQLNEYLQRKFPEENLRLAQRLRILTDDELKKFWEFRGPPDIGAHKPEPLAPFRFEARPDESIGDQKIRFQHESAVYAQMAAEHERRNMHFRDPGGDPEGSQGVCYILDECHIAFNARDWATVGRGAINYLSQHRKLGDIVWPITQAAGNLDKQFRSVAEDFTVCRNEYVAKFGIFKGRGRFVWKTYNSEPDRSSEPFLTGTFKFDGEEECYDTARGIGVHGNKADIGRRAKGIPILWSIPALIAFALVVCLIVPWLLGTGIPKFLNGRAREIAGTGEQIIKEKVGEAVVPKNEDHSGPSKPPSRFTAPQNYTPPTRVQEPTRSREQSNAQEPWPTGFITRNGRINVTMSDGTIISEEDNEPGKLPVLRRVTRTSAEINGKIMRFRGSPTVTPPRPVPVHIVEKIATPPPPEPQRVEITVKGEEKPVRVFPNKRFGS
jgi:hypothetical protein